MSARRAASLLGACAVVVAVGCGGSDSSDESGAGAEGASGPLIIGDASSQTGFASGYDNPANVGFRLKIDELNAAGGIGGRQIKVVRADSRSEVNESGNAAIKVLDEGAELLLAACDYDVGAPAGIAAEERGIATFSACAGSTKFGPEGIGPLAFTMATPSTTMGAILAEFAFKSKGWKTAYVLEDTSIDYSKQLCAGFKQRFAELAGEQGVVGTDTFKQGDASVASQITKMRDADADVIFPCSYNPGVASVIKQIRDAGIETPLVGDASLDGEEWKAAVPGLSDVYFVALGSIYGDDPEPAVNEFFEKYKEKTGEEPPTAYALTGYSVMEAFAKAIEKAGSTEGAKVAAALESFQEEPLAVGPTTFTKELHISLKRPMRLMEIQDGKTSFVEVVKPESVPLPKT